MKYPPLVSLLIQHCDAWIIGSAVSESNPRDYDIWIPINKWSIACGLIPKDSKINTFGGFKCISDNKEIDIWTCEMQELLQTNLFSKAFYPKSNIKIIKEI